MVGEAADEGNRWWERPLTREIGGGRGRWRWRYWMRGSPWKRHQSGRSLLYRQYSFGNQGWGFGSESMQNPIIEEKPRQVSVLMWRFLPTSLFSSPPIDHYWEKHTILSAHSSERYMGRHLPGEGSAGDTTGSWSNRRVLRLAGVTRFRSSSYHGGAPLPPFPFYSVALLPVAFPAPIITTTPQYHEPNPGHATRN